MASRTVSPNVKIRQSSTQKRSIGKQQQQQQQSVLASGTMSKDPSQIGSTFLTSLMGGAVAGAGGAVASGNLGSIQEHSYQWRKKVDEANKDVNKFIQGMDTQISDLLLRQEQECLQAVSLHWNRKHSQIVNLIEKIHAKHSNQSAKDQRILALQSKINFLSNEATRLSEALIKQKNQTTRMKTKVDTLKDDSKFFEKQVKETKRQNKLLKLALNRLQQQITSLQILQNSQGSGPSAELMRLHQLLSKAQNEALEKVGEGNMSFEEDQPGNSNILQGVGADSLLFPTQVGIVSVQKRQLSNQQKHLEFSGTSPSNYLPIQQAQNSILASDSKFAHQRSTAAPSQSQRLIPSQNLRFKIFLDTLYSVNLTPDQAKKELTEFISNLQGRYQAKIRELQENQIKMKNQIRKLKSIQTNQVTEKNQLEVIFVDAIEEVRKEIMRRRMKNQIASKKKFRGFNTKNAEQAQQFEYSLLKLANLAKKRIKYQDFTSTDKFNVIDLFVNNQNTLLKIYESLFPHRASQIPTAAPTAAATGGQLDKSQSSQSNRAFSTDLLNQVAQQGNQPISQSELIGSQNTNHQRSNQLNSESIEQSQQQQQQQLQQYSTGFLPMIKSKGTLLGSQYPSAYDNSQPYTQDIKGSSNRQPRSLSRPLQGYRNITGRGSGGGNTSLLVGAGDTPIASANMSMDAGQPAAGKMGITGQKTQLAQRPKIIGKIKNQGKQFLGQNLMINIDKAGVKSNIAENELVRGELMVSPEQEEEYMSVSSYHQQQMRSSFNH